MVSAKAGSLAFLLFLAIAVVSAFSSVQAAAPMAPTITDKKQLNGIVFDQNGWAALPEFLVREGPAWELSRIVFVSADGDDAAAATAKGGRGYYLPGDPEIGLDPRRPNKQVTAYKTFYAARQATRMFKEWGNVGGDGQGADWILFRRGDSFDLQGEYLIDYWVGGPDSNARRIYTAYGDDRQSRPKITNTAPSAVRCWGPKCSNIVVSSLDLSGAGGVEIIRSGNDILFEDVYFRKGISAHAGNLFFRRCIFSDGYNPNGHNSSIFVTRGSGLIWISESVFDMSGYLDDPLNPSQWTAGPGSDLVRKLSPGTGVQPTRTWFSRALYLSSYQRLVLERNIISRGGGGASVQMRVGGVARENSFIWNHYALQMGHALAERSFLQNGVVERNLFLHDEHFVPPGGWGVGVNIGLGNEEKGTISDNIFSHFHRSKFGAMIEAAGLKGNGPDPQENFKMLEIKRNILVSHENPLIRIFGGGAQGVSSTDINGNSLFRAEGADAPMEVSLAPDVSPSVFGIGVAEREINRYYLPNWKEFKAWQERGFDRFALNYANMQDLASDLGWSQEALGKDIVSYVQSIDPTYVPDENVSVDFGVPPANRRQDAPAVWQVLVDPGRYGGGIGSMSESRARLTARRFHAFITFMTRAKQNRKGYWDARYTAVAINNYFRQAFAKPLISPDA